MDSVFQSVGDLPIVARSAFEALIGHSLRDDQQLFIVALDNSPEPTAEQRRRAWDELSMTIAGMRASAVHSAAASAEIERVIDEECEQVRYGEKPCA